MEFSDSVWKDVQDSMPMPSAGNISSVVWQIPYRDSTFKFRFRLAGHGITTSDPDGLYNHFRPVFTRVFIYRKGGAQLIQQDRTYRLSPGKIYVLPTNMSFHIHYQPRELIYYHLCLDDQTGCSIFEDGEPFLELDLPVLYGQFLAVQKAGSEMEHWGALMTLLAHILAGRMERLYERTRKQKEFLRLFTYMDAHPLAQVTVGELAEICHVDSSTLSKRFHRKMGLSLKEFMQQRLLRQACELLLFSSGKVIDITRKLGFADPAYFYNFFRRQTGMTPQQFRKNQKE